MNSIYALTDPLTSEIRYIGKTRNVGQRHNSHCYTKSKTHVSRWIQRLKSENLFPTMVVIESGLSESEWPEAEQFWIEYYKSYGARLTNITKGGHDIVKQSQHPFGYTLGYKVPALFKNEMCYLVGGSNVLMFMQLTDKQVGWVKENERRCSQFTRIASKKAK